MLLALQVVQMEPGLQMQRGLQTQHMRMMVGMIGECTHGTRPGLQHECFAFRFRTVQVLKTSEDNENPTIVDTPGGNRCNYVSAAPTSNGRACTAKGSERGQDCQACVGANAEDA